MGSLPGSWATSDNSRKTMLANHGKDTKPELQIRRQLFRLGYRYRVHYRPIADVRRTADIAFTRLRVAIFVDGCFWHGCPVHWVQPRANAEFWKAKIEKNRQRDAETSELLASHNWTVVRIWEHESIAEAVERIEMAVRSEVK